MNDFATAMATYLTEKTKVEWSAEDYLGTFDPDYELPDGRYDELEEAMRASLPENLFDDVDSAARVDFAVHYAARNGQVTVKGADGLCYHCGNLFLEHWGKTDIVIPETTEA